MESSMHPWKARIGVGSAMLFLAFLGLIVTDVRSTGGWEYWQWVTPVYGLLALWLSWYLRRNSQCLSPVTLGHEALHWAGLVGSIFIVSYFVHLGIIGRFSAGLFALTLLSQAVFLAGIYIETSFLLIGAVLALFAMGIALTLEYLYALSLPLLLATLALIFWISRRNHPPKAPQ